MLKTLKINNKAVFGAQNCKIPRSFDTQNTCSPQEINRGPQYRDWPEKKDGGRKEYIMLEWLKKILGDAYTEDIDKQVSDQIGKGFVARADFNAKAEALKSAESQLSERDSQLEELKKASGDSEALKKQIEDLQTANQDAKKKHDKEMSDLKFGYALDAALTAAKVRDSLAVKAHLKTDELKLSEDGKITGLDAQLETLKKENDYLFESDKPSPTIGGPTPGAPGGKKTSEMTYTELAAYLEANPGAEI